MTNKNEMEVNKIWKLTELLRESFSAKDYGDIILPFILIRRLDCRLKDVNETVRLAYDENIAFVSEKELALILKAATFGLSYYNSSKYTLSSLINEPEHIEKNFMSYLIGFNQEVIDILDSLQFDKQIAKLVKNGLLLDIIEAVCQIDLDIKKLDNRSMRNVFDDIVRRSNELTYEYSGEFFTPRDVISLMNAFVYTPDKDAIFKSNSDLKIFDPACGTGGMLNLGKEYILDNLTPNQSNEQSILTFGQELNEKTFAMAKFIALVSDENSENIMHGNSLTDDQFTGEKFNYILSNPPMGVAWKKESFFIENEALDPTGRFYAGTPGTNDSQLLFIQHMLSKMDDNLGSRIAVISNQSPLINGGAGRGESEIRKWIIENDWLECIVALPSNLLFNTGVDIYLWILTNKKAPHRKGKVQLINGNAEEVIYSDRGIKLRTIPRFSNVLNSRIGRKRSHLTSENIDSLLKLYLNFKENKYSKILNNDDFGFYQITIDQPVYLNGEIVEEQGCPKPDKQKREIDIVPLTEDLEKYFRKEILSQFPDAWINYEKIHIGFEINFSKIFYEYEDLPSTSQLKEEIVMLESEISQLLNDLLED